MQKDKASLGYLRALMTANGVKRQYRGHVESILTKNPEREEWALKCLQRTTPQWFETENA